MNLAQLEAFVEAARWGSFRRAADALSLSQPSLSERIRRLEEEVGERLFLRQGRGVRLTLAGKALLPHAERALEAVRRGREAVSALNDDAAERLYVGASRTIGTYVLPDLLHRFRQDNPGVEVSVRTGRSSDILRMVVEQEVQVGVARALFHPQVETVHLYDEEVVLTTHPAHPFAGTGRVSIYDVAQEPLIFYEMGSTFFVLIDSVCREAGIVPRVQMQLDSMEATKQMVARGLGVSFLPLSAIRREVAQGVLKRVDLEEDYRVTMPTALMVHRRLHRSQAVQSFIALLTYALGAGGKTTAPQP